MAKAKTKVKVQKTRAQKLSIDNRYMGPEPEPFEATDGRDQRLAAALRWYGYFYNQEDGKKWLLKYVKDNYPKEIVSAIRSAPTWKTSMTAATLAHLLDRGVKLPECSMEFLDARIRENALFVKNEEEDSVPAKQLNPHLRLQKKIDGQLADIEEMLDRAIFDGDELNFYTWATANAVTPNLLLRVKEKYTPVLQEAIDHPKHFNGRARKVFESLLADIERLQTNKKTVRAVRKPKPMTTEKQVKGLKFKKDDHALKLVSIAPESIIGARELWVYSTKYNELGVFVAKTDMGLRVKGTSITEFDETKSIVKKVRDTKILGDVLKGRPRKVLDSLKTNAKPISARVNENVILLRAVK